MKKIKLCQGVGLSEVGEFQRTINGKLSKEYSLWTGLLHRCYSEKFLSKNKSYEGCFASENFKNFQYFAKWCQEQVGFKVTGYELDKDLLQRGNREYSENTCVFLPPEINSFLVKPYQSERVLPVGVQSGGKGGTFKASIGGGSDKVITLGYSETVEGAFVIYKSAKESKAKQLAIKYKGLVDERVIEALNNYTVEVTD